MNIINNRYRIINTIDKKQIFSSFEVTDILRNDSNLKLNIIELRNIPNNTKNHIKNEFINLVNLNENYIYKLYSLNVISTIDNKTEDDKRWYYTCEICKESSRLVEVIDNLEENDIIDIFVQICIAIQYLNNSGYAYRNINSKNIYIKRQNGKVNIKLNDLISSELEKIKENYAGKREWFQFDFKLDYGEKYSEIVSNEIRDLGILLFELCKSKFSSNTKINNSLELQHNVNKAVTIKNPHKEFEMKIIPIINKMICNTSERYTNIKAIVEDINIVFSRRYNIYDVKAFEKLNYNVKIVGRDGPINKVLNLCSIFKNVVNKSNLFIVHGKSGIGKTRFLKEIRYFFKFNMDNVYCSFGNRDNITRNIFDEILKQILTSYDTRIIKSYEREIGKKIINKLKDSKNITTEEEKIDLFDKCINFMNVMASKKRLVIIVDNVDKVDELSTDFIKYFYEKVRNTKNIVFMFSYLDEIIYTNNDVGQFISSFKVNFTDIILNELNFVSTNELIKEVLGTSILPRDFSKKIFEKTKGNPGFIIEVLKGLYVRKYIYVSKDNGLWVTSYDKINEIPIHSSLVKNIQNQINDMCGFELEIVNAMCIFNIGLKLETIKMFFKEYDGENIEEIIRKLLKRGIIEAIEEDSDTYYAIANKTIKAALTDRMDEEYKSSINERAAEVLEKSNPSKYKEEILFHFEKSLNVKKIIEYYLNKYQYPIYIKNKREVVSKIKKLVKTIRNNTTLSGIKLLIILGDLLFLDEKDREAQEYYKLSEKLLHERKEYEIQFQVLKRLVRMLQNNSQLKESRIYIYRQEELLRNWYNLELELLIYTEEAFNFYLTKEFERAISICNNVIDKCTHDMEDVKFYAYYVLSNSYIEKGDMKQAEKYSKMCSDKRYLKDNLPYVLDSLNNIAYIYGNYYEEYLQCKNYLFRVFQIATHFNYSHFKLLSLSQIATLDFKQGSYKEAYNGFENVLGLSKKINDKYIELYCYCRLCKVCLVMYDIEEAYEYFLKASTRIDDLKNYLDLMGVYYSAAVEIYLKMGMPEKAKEYMKEFKDKCGSQNIKKIDEVVGYYIDYLIDSNETAITTFRKALSGMDFTNKNVNSIVIIVQIAIIVYWKKDLEMFNDIYIMLSRCNIKNKLVRDCIGIIRTLNLSNEEMLKYAINTLRKCENDIKISKFLYVNICNYYLKSGSYIRAINYCFEYIDFMWNYYLKVPDKYKENFVRCYKIKNDLREYIDIINNYMGQKIVDEKSVEGILSKEGIEKFYENTDLKKLFYTKQLKKDLKKYYFSFIPRKVNSRINVMRNQVESSVINIQNILKYLKYSLIAKKIYFIVMPTQTEDTVVFTHNQNFVDNNIIKENTIIYNVSSKRNPIFIKRVGLKPNMELEENIKAVICIPVYTVLSNLNKRNNKEITGILYIESDKILNNFNVNAINKCIEFNGLISLNVDKYRLKMSSTIDVLTGTMTRRHLEIYMDDLLDENRNFIKEFTVLMYDLDNFKAINDKFGHGTGDLVLKEVSKIVMNNIEEKSVCARYGGEEFIVILPNHNVLKAYEVADKIRRRIDKAKILGNKRSVTISIGLVAYPDMAISKEEIFEKVDKALYIAKNTGRNKCVIWNERFNYKARATNKITGIVTGNPVKDSRNVLVTVEFIEMLKSSISTEEKIFNALGRLVEFFEATYCTIILLKDKKVSNVYTRKIFKSDFIKKTYINDKIVREVLEKKIGVYMIDWDNISGFDETTGMPDWDSIMVIPLINKGIINGILYFKVPAKIKEFNFEEFNFASAISNIVAALF